MSGSVIAIDANAIENLWAGGGAAAWDQLLKAGAFPTRLGAEDWASGDTELPARPDRAEPAIGDRCAGELQADCGR